MTDIAESGLTSPSPFRSQVERLTDQFYAWERRGRGWQTWSYPVELEPPFRPFEYHYAPATVPIDDGRKPTLLSSLAESLMRKLVGTTTTRQTCEESVYEIEEPEPEVGEFESPIVVTAVTVPPETVISREATEQFLLSLTTCPGPVTFELIARGGSVELQFACSERDSAQLTRQLRAHFPAAVLAPAGNLVTALITDPESTETVVVEFGLSHEFMLPLRVARGFDPDPLIGIIGALADAGENELAMVQVIFHAARQPWVDSIRRAVTDGGGGAFFADAPEFLPLAKEKITRPLFAAVLRVVATSATAERAWDLARMIGSSFTQFGNPTSNELIPLSDSASEEIDARALVLSRLTMRSGMLLNCSELASLVHLPSVSVRSAELRREIRKTKAAPTMVTGHRLLIGENYHAGTTTEVTLSPEQRLRHTYVIGASGTGKSTLLLNMIVQDVENGEGLAVLDPHGDLIDDILARIPENRFDDVVLLDASDSEYPVGFNILSAHSDLERNLLSSDLVAIFRRLSTSWGDQMTSVLGNAVTAFLESSEGGTLADLRRFLVEKEFRDRFLTTVHDREIVYFWQKEFPLLVGRPQAPLLTRLDAFLRPKAIRYMVGQKENRINFRQIMDEGKILLVKLAQGAVGEENAYLLGSLLVSRFHQTALSRQEADKKERRDFYLYIDEFQNFVTPSMATILSAARKYHLGLILAHQELRQLSTRSEDVASAVLSNPATRICFRVGDQDARKLESGFAFFEARDLQNLGVGEAICRVDRADNDFNMTTSVAAPVDDDTAGMRRGEIVARTRHKYGRKREELEGDEARGTARSEAEVGVESASPPKSARQEAVQVVPRPVTPPERPDSPRIQVKGTPTPGRGGAQHKYLQQLIKRWAESRGYRVTIEKPILDGLGSVDVALEKDDISVACEICVTTSPEHELGNLQKCLAAGFKHVVQIATDRKSLTALSAASKSLGNVDPGRVRFLLTEELFAFLEEQAVTSNNQETTVRGYKVRVKYKTVGPEDQKLKKQAITQTILKAMSKLKAKQ